MSGRISHVIFDFSGTIADTLTPSFDIMRKAFLAYGKELKMEHLENLAEAESSDDVIKTICQRLDLQRQINLDKDKIGTMKNELIKQVRDVEMKMVPGLERLLAHLHSEGIPMAIATNIKSTDFNPMAARVKGFKQEYFSHIVYGGDDPDVKENKPSPDIYQVCSQRFAEPPTRSKNCLIFEDSVLGITGGLRTGMKVVLVHNPYSADPGELKKRLTASINTFDDLDMDIVGLPSYF